MAFYPGPNNTENWLLGLGCGGTSPVAVPYSTKAKMEHCKHQYSGSKLFFEVVHGTLALARSVTTKAGLNDCLSSLCLYMYMCTYVFTLMMW